MTDEEEGLKSFMESHFDFYGLKKAGFFGKDIKKRDYQKQADKICHRFSLSSVFEYVIIGHGVPVHISSIASIFKCPICTCEQEVPGSDKIVYTVKCAGCKRKLSVSPAGYNKYAITEIGGRKETTETYFVDGDFTVE